MGFLEVFWVFLYVFRGVPGFLEGVPGSSGFFTLFPVFRGVPGCSGVPVFRCSGFPGITTCLNVLVNLGQLFQDHFV